MCTYHSCQQPKTRHHRCPCRQLIRIGHQPLPACNQPPWPLDAVCAVTPSSQFNSCEHAEGRRTAAALEAGSPTCNPQNRGQCAAAGEQLEVCCQQLPIWTSKAAHQATMYSSETTPAGQPRTKLPACYLVTKRAHYCRMTTCDAHTFKPDAYPRRKAKSPSVTISTHRPSMGALHKLPTKT